MRHIVGQQIMNVIQKTKLEQGNVGQHGHTKWPKSLSNVVPHRQKPKARESDLLG